MKGFVMKCNSAQHSWRHTVTGNVSLRWILLFVLSIFHSARAGTPFFNVQPTNQIVVPGANATFSAIATGSAPLTYQWRRNGTNLIPGGVFGGVNASTLILTNARNFH